MRIKRERTVVFILNTPIIVKHIINYTLELARLGNLASGAREVGVKNPSHRFLKCPLIFGLYYN
jgi:hypothetical protein